MNSTNFPENSSRRYYWKDLWEAQEAKHADPQAQPVLANWWAPLSSLLEWL
jgi:hypothetical protein